MAFWLAITSPYSSSENTDKLIRILQNLHQYVKFTDVLIMDDFNFTDITNWDSLCVYDGASSITQLFLDAVQDAFNPVCFPTNSA